jgi:hypothetical protein
MQRGREEAGGGEVWGWRRRRRRRRRAAFQCPVSREKQKAGFWVLFFFWLLHHGNISWSISKVSMHRCNQKERERITNLLHPPPWIPTTESNKSLFYIFVCFFILFLSFPPSIYLFLACCSSLFWVWVFGWAPGGGRFGMCVCLFL